ncbi:MAG: MBL fold metallo-hydrolase [Bacteroidales bacterium]|nr:MBL fold metallo-hydrolase [Bacteroidales bacterium]
MDRRNFIKASIASAGALAVGGVQGCAGPAGTEKEVQIPGQKWTGWRKGHFQIHFIYTGVGESAFYIFPDGTTMLLDCGDHNAIGRGKLAVPVLPHSAKHSGEWVARYVERVNPQGREVDYMMISHYHSDHAGNDEFFAGEEMWEGEPYRFSGFSQAAQTLRFGKAFDRCYPATGDPLPLPDDFDSSSPAHIRRFYKRMQKECGLKVEKFEVGAVDQIRMLRDAASYPGFSIRNICGNGRIAEPDGTVRDLYEEYINREHPDYINENAMSLGFVASYGPFRFFTAGDFSDSLKLADGSRVEIEDLLGEVCEPVDVAKINHHGHHSMYPGLVKALSPQVYVSCVWDQLHNLPDTLSHIDDRSSYEGDRVLYAGIYPPERRAEDDGQEWQRVVDPSCYEGSHIVLDVDPSGRKFSITTIAACDESMTVRTYREFATRG